MRDVLQLKQLTLEVSSPSLLLLAEQQQHQQQRQTEHSQSSSGAPAAPDDPGAAATTAAASSATAGTPDLLLSEMLLPFRLDRVTTYSCLVALMVLDTLTPTQKAHWLVASYPW